jgi:predicted ArsR family transcriptional regulator
MLASAHCDLTVQRSLTIEEIAAILSVKPTQVKRQLEELASEKGDPTVSDQQPECGSPPWGD